MPDRSKDELARALEALAGGQIADDGHPPRPTAPRPLRPSTPSSPASSRPAAPQSMRPATPQSSAADDDDAVIVPAPPPSAFLHYRSGRTAPRPGLTLRRTLIPVLLTCGVILLVLGALPRFLSSENPLSQMPYWLSFVLWGAGAFVLVMAAINMLAVKHLLEAQAQGRPR